MDCKEFDCKIPYSIQFDDIENHVKETIGYRDNRNIQRFVATSFDRNHFNTHILVADGCDTKEKSIFSFNKRKFHLQKNFNVGFLIPTGIGCDLGGHAGDANATLKLISSACDQVVTHPNVVNASDINEMTENTFYVEGSHLTQLIMGNIGLNKVKNNRILVIISNDDQTNKDKFLNAAINSVNAARVTLGLEADIVLLDNPMQMRGSVVKNEAAKGEVVGLDSLYNLLSEKQGSYDAVAITSKISIPEHLHRGYSESNGDIANPWGSCESMLTHFISSEFQVPSAHAPMFESELISEMDFGVVDSRIAAEVISTTFFHCVLKGLQQAPSIISDISLLNQPDIFSAKDISAIVIPDGILGLPVLGALHQGIKVIAVKNKNYMNNDLTKLPWKKGQFYQCENYLEATGILHCLKTGISIESVQRPLSTLLMNESAQEEHQKDSPVELSP